MQFPFKIGEKVICVQLPKIGLQKNTIELGKTYTITAIRPCPYDTTRFYINIAEFPWQYGYARFSKLPSLDERINNL